MLLTSLLSAVAPLALSAHGLRAASNDPVCDQINNATSSATSVHYLGDPRYSADISHQASSSSEFPKCSVRPGTAADVGTILQIVGSNRIPFGVKGGGHASNPGFSSTTGVLIAMSRFSEVTYDAASQIVVVGAGLIWDDVYAALAPHNVNVVGGRVTGVGVAGFILGGGGYSWLTNQYGLTIDTVTAFELVKPDGVAVNVTQLQTLIFSSDSKDGGMNNFGIVTRFTLKTFPQGRVWGGLITYLLPNIPAVTAATAHFSTSVTDPKASIISMYNTLLGVPGIFVLMFYDGPEPPSGIFDDFLATPHLTKDVSTRDFLSLVKVSPANATQGQRAIFNTVSIESYTPTLLEAIHNETAYWGARLALKSGFFISYDVEPFLPSILSHAGVSSAYPASRSTRFSPFHMYYAWSVGLFDADFHDAARQSAARIKELAIKEGQNVRDATLYPNLAIYDTPLEAMYGPDNVLKLRVLKERMDPENVMGFAGGFKI